MHSSRNIGLVLILCCCPAAEPQVDATVDFSDGASGEKLAQVAVDRNSWGLGGGIAAGQTVEGFMQGAAEKIARQLADSKNVASTSR